METITARYQNAGYGKFKADLADLVVEKLVPIQERVQELSEPGVIEKILEAGAEKAKQVAKRKLALFQRKLGL